MLPSASRISGIVNLVFQVSVIVETSANEQREPSCDKGSVSTRIHRMIRDDLPPIVFHDRDRLPLRMKSCFFFAWLHDEVCFPEET